MHILLSASGYAFNLESISTPFRLTQAYTWCECEKCAKQWNETEFAVCFCFCFCERDKLAHNAKSKRLLFYSESSDEKKKSVNDKQWEMEAFSSHIRSEDGAIYVFAVDSNRIYKQIKSASISIQQTTESFLYFFDFSKCVFLFLLVFILSQRKIVKGNGRKTFHTNWFAAITFYWSLES